MATKNHATGELITIPARGGKAVSIRQGQAVKVINTHGSQVGDTWAFNSQDLTEFMSMDATRATICKLRAGIGDSYYTNRRRAILMPFSTALAGKKVNRVGTALVRRPG